MSLLPSRTIVERSMPDRWEMVCGDPHPTLQAHVSSYTWYTELAVPASGDIQLPHPDIVFIINLGPPIRVIDPRDASSASRKRNVFIAGLHDSYVFTESLDLSRGIQVNLTPIGAYLFLGMPMDSFANRVVELDEVFGASARHLVERLRNAPDAAACFDLLDEAILARVAETPPPPGAIVWAWRVLRGSEGRASIGGLTKKIGCSQKYLIAKFREHVGLPPKAFARIVRFDTVVRRLRAAERSRFDEVAQDCGYFDQAHFTKDFQEFAGRTPGKFLGR